MRKLQGKEQRRKEGIWFRGFQAQTSVQDDKLKATLLSHFITLISTGGTPEESLARQVVPAKQKHSQVTLKLTRESSPKRVKAFCCSQTVETLKKKPNQNPTPNYILLFFFSDFV